MIYLLDANAIIDASRDYYPLTVVPEYWPWLVHLGNTGSVKIPIEVWEEITPSEGEFKDWMHDTETKNALLLEMEADPVHVQSILENGYAQNLDEVDYEKIGRDPFLISYALTDPKNFTIVTSEVSKPKLQGANRKVPDVCREFSVRSINNFSFIRELNFSTGWKN